MAVHLLFNIEETVAVILFGVGLPCCCFIRT